MVKPKHLFPLFPCSLSFLHTRHPSLSGTSSLMEDAKVQEVYIGRPWLLLTENLHSPIASMLAPTASIGNSNGKIIPVVNVNIYL